MPYRTRRERRYRRKQAKAAAPSPQNPRGWGEGAPISRGDWLLVRRAIRKRWEVPAATREAICDRIGDFVDAGDWPDDGRMLVAVARAMLAMEDDNIRATRERLQSGAGSSPLV